MTNKPMHVAPCCAAIPEREREVSGTFHLCAACPIKITKIISLRLCHCVYGEARIMITVCVCVCPSRGVDGRWSRCPDPPQPGQRRPANPVRSVLAKLGDRGSYMSDVCDKCSTAPTSDSSLTAICFCLLLDIVTCPCSFIY